jgi:hypothetical protein
VHVIVLSLFTLVIVNWRMYAWLAAMGEVSVERARRLIPLWTLNLFVAVLCGVMLATVYMSFAWQPDETSSTGERPNSRGG